LRGLPLKGATTLILAACFTILLTGVTVGVNLQRVLTLWGEDVQITAYLSPELEGDGREALIQSLQTDQRVGRVEHVDRDRAMEDFRSQMASYAPDLMADDDLLSLIPASLMISLSTAVPVAEQLGAMKAIAQELGQRPGVDDVRYGQEWVRQYSAFVAGIQFTLGAIGLILFVAAAFIISNAIRASVETRRSEIEILELIGARQWMIRKPHVIEGAVMGAAAGLVAVILAAMFYRAFEWALVHELKYLRLAEHLSFLGPFQIVTAILGGAGLGALASYLCVRSINSGWAAARRGRA
jgi:cell division transport system permease protein